MYQKQDLHILHMHILHDVSEDLRSIDYTDLKAVWNRICVAGRACVWMAPKASACWKQRSVLPGPNVKQEILQRLQVHSCVGNGIPWLAGPVGLHLAGTHLEVRTGSDQRRSGFCLALGTNKANDKLYCAVKSACVFLRRLFKSSIGQPVNSKFPGLSLLTFRSQAEGYQNLRTVTLRPMWMCLKDWAAFRQPAGASSFKHHALHVFGLVFCTNALSCNHLKSSLVHLFSVRASSKDCATVKACRSTANDAACLKKQESWGPGERRKRLECHSADMLALVNPCWFKSRPDLFQPWWVLAHYSLNEEPLVSEEPDVWKQEVFRLSIYVEIVGIVWEGTLFLFEQRVITVFHVQPTVCSRNIELQRSIGVKQQPKI